MVFNCHVSRKGRCDEAGLECVAKDVLPIVVVFQTSKTPSSQLKRGWGTQ
jgi:hypothetical protein